MNVPLRELRLRTLSIARSIQYRPHRAAHQLQGSKQPGSYYDKRKPPGWWRRQDFDDKMTYVVEHPPDGSLMVGNGLSYDDHLYGVCHLKDTLWARAGKLLCWPSRMG